MTIYQTISVSVTNSSFLHFIEFAKTPNINLYNSRVFIFLLLCLTYLLLFFCLCQIINLFVLLCLYIHMSLLYFLTIEQTNLLHTLWFFLRSFFFFFSLYSYNMYAHIVSYYKENKKTMCTFIILILFKINSLIDSNWFHCLTIRVLLNRYWSKIEVETKDNKRLYIWQHRDVLLDVLSNSEQFFCSSSIQHVQSLSYVIDVSYRQWVNTHHQHELNCSWWSSPLFIFPTVHLNIFSHIEMWSFCLFEERPTRYSYWMTNAYETSPYD